VPFVGGVIPGIWDGMRYDGGPSVHAVTSTDVLFSVISLPVKIPGATRAARAARGTQEIVGYVMQGVDLYSGYQFINGRDRVILDYIARGLFEANNIPTSHTRVSHNAYPEDSAAPAVALLTAQMNATYTFIALNSDYFLSEIIAGRTTHEIFRRLSGYSCQKQINNAIEHYIEAWQAELVSRGLDRTNPGWIGYTELLTSDEWPSHMDAMRHFLGDFRNISNKMNTLYVSTIASATCAVLSPITPVPPTPLTSTPATPPPNNRNQPNSPGINVPQEKNVDKIM